ncbi:nucleoside hydrolase [Fictibacillus nanhaiensis]|uniref:nucleoside hydrolase n=1 Tax=Fictibacillus nanhaiensis TaxID=742169 RepID=UPI001FE7E9A1|nr:nucleoside hydrolase [Fictibacillus nanhaiensis]
MKKNILFFGDPGIDDTLAIIYALLHPNINLVGIVAGYGNVTREQTAKNTYYLLDLANRKDIPVIGGAIRSVVGESGIFYPEIHGEDGLGPIQPPESFAKDLNAFDDIYKIIDKYPDVTIVDVGRNSSLATAFTLDDKSMEKVKEIHIMGGAFLVPGNVTPVAEANFHGDPVSTNIVLARGNHVTIAPLNVTNYAIIKPKTIDFIATNMQPPFGALIKPIFDYYFQAYQKLIPGIEGTPLHDVFTLWALMNPKSVQKVTKQVNVVNDNASKGLSIADFRAKPVIQPNIKFQDIILKFNYKAFVEDFTTTLLNHY